MAKYKAKTKECQLIVKVKLSSGEKINERELDFFTRKYIRGLLKAKMVKKFGFTSIEYTGPIGISLFERLKKPITKYDFLFIIEQIVDISQKVQVNSMSLNKVVWDIHNVFINETTREVQFIYLPLENVEKEADIIALIDSVVYSANTVCLVCLRGYYDDFTKKTNIAFVFINQLGKPIKELHGEIRINVESKEVKFAKTTIDFDEIFCFSFSKIVAFSTSLYVSPRFVTAY